MKNPKVPKHIHHSPLDAVGQLAGGSHAGYWGAAMQRISELRRQGFAIVSGWAPIAGPGGTVSLTAVYYLAEPDTRQRDLFPEGATA